MVRQPDVSKLAAHVRKQVNNVQFSLIRMRVNTNRLPRGHSRRRQLAAVRARRGKNHLQTSVQRWTSLTHSPTATFT